MQQSAHVPVRFCIKGSCTHQDAAVCTGDEDNAVVPLEMINEAFKASSPGLLVADVRFKGGMYVELTQTSQHVEYIYVNTIATENYQAFCGMAYDAPARENTSTELIINPGTCGAIPGKLNTAPLHRQN